VKVGKGARPTPAEKGWKGRRRGVVEKAECICLPPAEPDWL
jgi:hypothetical protein